MKGLETSSDPTLWDLAAIVLEETEKVCVDEGCAMALAGEVLIHIIREHVTNMEVEGCGPHQADREREGRAGGRACRRLPGG